MSTNPAKTLGILGGGQLGRMSAQAASKLGIKVVIFTPEQDSPAGQVADQTIIAEYSDETALTNFANAVDVISYEFENIPVETVRYLKKLKPVYPEENLLEIAQDRVREKSYLNDIGIPTARWKVVESQDDANKALTDWGVQKCVIKTARWGYDGKGQVSHETIKDNSEFFSKYCGQTLIMEEFIDFECEISLIAARDQQGKTEIYGPMLNEHRNHILWKTSVPAPISPEITDQATKMVKMLADSVNLVGVLTLELFVTKDGKILANEIAPRTHNSGHWTIEACTCSQFENHVRCVTGLEAGSAARTSAAQMINLIGDEVHDAERLGAEKSSYIHLYGKKEARPGRKMGHMTRLISDPSG